MPTQAPIAARNCTSGRPQFRSLARGWGPRLRRLYMGFTRVGCFSAFGSAENQKIGVGVGPQNRAFWGVRDGSLGGQKTGLCLLHQKRPKQISMKKTRKFGLSPISFRFQHENQAVTSESTFFRFCGFREPTFFWFLGKFAFGELGNSVCCRPSWGNGTNFVTNMGSATPHVSSGSLSVRLAQSLVGA